MEEGFMSESGVAQIEAVPGNRHKSPSGIRTGAGTVGPALVLVLAVIGFEQFLHDDVDRLARTVAVTSGHSHGHGGAHDDEVHWAGDAVFRALILVPLAAAAVWGGEQAGRRCSAGGARARSML